MSSYTGFTLHRKVRRLRRNARLWRTWFANYLHRHVYGSWQKLGNVRWPFASWVFIIFISIWGLTVQIQSLGTISQVDSPQNGGVYREAVLGVVKSVNPLFPDNSASEDVSSLVFSGLTKINGRREITPDIADRWDVSDDRREYTFYLRPSVKWQDGTKLTASDIAFTIERVQNPDTRSPFLSNWSGVKYLVVDENTIKFILPSSYGNFLANTTLGVLPKHLLGEVKPSSLRSYEFNQRPIGSGPYKLELLEVDSSVVELTANEFYYIHTPYIPKVRIELFEDADEMLGALVRKQVDAVSQVPPSKLEVVDKIESVTTHRLGLPAYVGAFFNLKSPILNNPDLRKSLAYSVDRRAIIDSSLEGEAVIANYPIPAGYPGFNSSAQKYDYDIQKSKELYEKSGAGNAKIRVVTLENSSYESVANSLAESWRLLGLEVEVITADSTQLQQNYIRSRNYDVLVYGQNLGLASDVYSFWHSSQSADPGLNVSAYKNTEVDNLLESGRLAKDPAYKATRYSSFVDLWAKDVPALILYSPYYNYSQTDSLKGFDAKKIQEPSNRFYNIYDWYLIKR